MRRFGIGDRVVFTDWAAENINMPVLYKDVNHTIIAHSFDSFNHEITKNINILKGIIVRITEDDSNYSLLIEYKGEFVFSECTDEFLQRDVEYYRDKNLETILK